MARASLNLTARQSLLVTVAVTSLMLALNIVSLIAHFKFGLSGEHPLVRFLNMEFERNIPTAWSVVLLLYAAALLAHLSKKMFEVSDKYKWNWGLLSVAFVYLGMDEAFELHEKSMWLTSHLFSDYLVELNVVFYYSWIIPAGILLALMGVFYLKFTFHLPVRTRNLFIVSCVIYAGSAIGFELLEGPLEVAGGWMSLPYAILVTFEETFEMLGICLFTYAVIDYRNNRFPIYTMDAQGS